MHSQPLIHLCLSVINMKRFVNFQIVSGLKRNKALRQYYFLYETMHNEGSCLIIYLR